MIRPIDEIWIARDAMERIITLRAKYDHVEWACEACEIQGGNTWRIAMVLYATNGVFWRSNIFVAVPATPYTLVEHVETYLSQF